MYRTFVRTWWKDNPSWPNGLEPSAGEPEHCDEYDTEEEARNAAQEYNRTHEAGRYSKKMEFEEI